ncbi:MAG: leucine-rich repeat protein [Prevotella sp.]|nr:leucine-rich repeat protein [Prevotella sp.]
MEKILTTIKRSVLLLLSMAMPLAVMADEVTVTDENGNDLVYSFEGDDGPATFTRVKSYSKDGAKAGHIVIADAVTVDGKSHIVKYVSGSVGNRYNIVSIVFGKNIVATGGPDGSSRDAFSGCQKLTSVTLNKKLEILGTYTFLNCYNLESINLGDCTNLTTIMASAIEDCDYVRQITVPASVTTIEQNAFYSIDSLRTVNIGSGVKSIGEGAFRNCFYLKKINIDEGVSNLAIDKYAFAESDRLPEVNLPAGVVSLGNGAFRSCDSLRTVTFAKGCGITEIPYECFAHCLANLETITLPDAVQTIGTQAFYNCKALKEVNFGKGVTTINDWHTFSYCEKLEKFVLPGTNNPFTSSVWMPADMVLYVHPEMVDLYRENEYTKNYHIMPIGKTTSYKVTTTEGGQLQSKVREDQAQITLELTVSGPINGTDINYLHSAFPNLQVLDLTNARIVAGGDKYNQWNVAQNGNATIETYYGPWETEDDVVGYAMFYNMPSLRSLSLPKDVTKIGDYAIAQDRRQNLRLESVTIPSGVTEIGHHAFHFTGIKEVTVPAGVTRIEEYTFWNCQKLQKAVLPDNITFIGNSAFSENYELLDVNIPAKVDTIDQHAFYNNYKRSTPIVIPNTCKMIGYRAFHNNYVTPSVTFGNSIETIGSYAFAECHLIEKAVLPETVTRIGDRAFLNCDSLRTFTFPQNIKEVEGWVLEGCDALTKVTLAKGTTSIGESAFNGCRKLSDINLTDQTSLTTLHNYAFYGTALKNVTLPNSITEIGWAVFQDCNELESINVPTGIDYVPYDYCEDSEKLRSVQMHDGIRTILHDAFYGCDSLENIKLNDKITTIEYNAFYGCEKLALKKLPDALTFIGSNAFRDMKAMTGTMTIPTGVTTIEDGAFRNSGITAVVMPEGITKLGDDIFNSCASLSGVKLPKDIRRIPNYTFQRCKSLEGIDLPNELREIGYAAFDLSGLTAIELPDSLKKVESYAFSSTQLTTFRVPDGFTDDLGSWTLSSCKKLKSVYFGRNQDYTQWVDFTCCSGCDSLEVMRIYAGTPPKCNTGYMPYRKRCVLEVPEEQIALYKEANGWKEFKEIRGFGLGDELAEQDFAVLQELYNKLDGAKWTKPWDLSNNHHATGKWVGVTTAKLGGTSSTTYAITGIDLTDQGLTGELPASVFKLSQLVTLNLSHNHVSGDLGSYTVNKGSLISTLNLEGNKFTGDLYALASQLPELTKLNVAYNQLAEISKPLPKEKLKYDDIRLECQFIDWHTKTVAENIDNKFVQEITVGQPFELKPTTLFTYRHNDQDYAHKAGSLARVWCDGVYWHYDWEFNTYDGLLNVGLNGDNLIYAPKDMPVAYSDLDWHWRTVLLRLTWPDGDVNADQTVDVQDLQNVIYYALHTAKPSKQMYNFTAADDNQDGKINVIDITRSVDYVLATSQPAASRVHKIKEVYGSGQNMLFCNGSDLSLMNTDEVAAMQFDVIGASQRDIHVSADMSSRFSVAMKNVPGGVRVVFYSSQGNTLSAGTHQLLVQLPVGATVVEAVLTDQETHRLGVGIDGNESAGIDQLVVDSKADLPIYDLSGRRVGPWDTLPAGIYIVRLNGQQYKLRK